MYVNKIDKTLFRGLYQKRKRSLENVNVIVCLMFMYDLFDVHFFLEC